MRSDRNLDARSSVCRYDSSLLVGSKSLIQTTFTFEEIQHRSIGQQPSWIYVRIDLVLCDKETRSGVCCLSSDRQRYSITIEVTRASFHLKIGAADRCRAWTNEHLIIQLFVERKRPFALDDGKGRCFGVNRHGIRRYRRRCHRRSWWWCNHFRTSEFGAQLTRAHASGEQHRHVAFVVSEIDLQVFETRVGFDLRDDRFE